MYAVYRAADCIVLNVIHFSSLLFSVFDVLKYLSLRTKPNEHILTTRRR